MEADDLTKLSLLQCRNGAVSQTLDLELLSVNKPSDDLLLRYTSLRDILPSSTATANSPAVSVALWGRLYRNRDTEADLIERKKLLEVFLGRAEAVAEDQNLRWENVAQKQTKLFEEVLEELATVKEKNESLEQEARKLRKVQQKRLPRFVHGSTSESGAKGAYQEVRRDVRQEVRQEVLHCAAVSNKPKVVHQCNNMKVRQEVLKYGCAAGTRKETDRCISNCVRPSKKQHRMCCWLCGKVGQKKVECFAREKSRNMVKKVNKMFTKPKRVEDVLLAKSGLLDEIKEETSEEGCSSVRSDLEVDQEASSLEPGPEVVCGTKGKKIKRALGADEEGLMVKETTHEGSLVLNRSWSKDSSTGASDRDAGENGDILVQRMHISWGRKAWCGAHLVGEKSTFGMKVFRDRDTEADLIEREKLLEVFLGRAEAVAEQAACAYLQPATPTPSSNSSFFRRVSSSFLRILSALFGSILRLFPSPRRIFRA
ncbi:hypothetical protein IGI04_015203 [Brassica rapa subsp. trilocularis]|uniref:Uncharacterized protein n=1 Tax=Brassica rapa subsp. trilocularis TaxID=1813537 RepID=A0ABQ7MSF1_BRACM|nr:hypothetical protein IGI04_015203 [Brassica rapa subsp. trilocularis]